MNLFAQTDVGRVRKNNEDNYYLAKLTNCPSHYIALVSDGVGGREFGEVASQITVEVFQQLVHQGRLDLGVDIKMRAAMLEMSARRAHLAICDKGKTDKRFAGMCCTLIAVLIDRERVGFVNVGDSRLYHFSADHLSQVSEDQTVATALFKDGRISATELKTHHDRNVLQHALGVEAANHPLEPQTAHFAWQQGDKLLLCSDGLTDMVNDADISALMSDFNGQALVEQLIKRALDAGGKDNITLVLCENLPGENLSGENEPDN